MKTTKELIEDYAHDYNGIIMDEKELIKMLWEFWEESEKEMRIAHLQQFMSRIDSHGFFEWYFT